MNPNTQAIVSDRIALEIQILRLRGFPVSAHLQDNSICVFDSLDLPLAQRMPFSEAVEFFATIILPDEATASDYLHRVADWFAGELRNSILSFDRWNTCTRLLPLINVLNTPTREQQDHYNIQILAQGWED
jgi:hypothetical protein